MIKYAQPLPVGNAIRLFLAPPDGAVSWRVLRKADNTFTNQDDPDALVVHEGDEKVFVDHAWLPNDTQVHYRPFYLASDGTWSAGPTKSATARATYEEASTEVLEILRNRLEDGLAVEVARGEFTSRINHIQVLTAPPSMEGSIHFPLVTVHLDHEGPSEQFVGGLLLESEVDEISGEWEESDGYLAQVQVSVVGWSQNADERIDLRKAIRRIIVSNLPVFGDLGMAQVEYSAQDVDAVNGEYPALIYQCLGTFSCTAPIRVVSSYPTINATDVRSTND